MTELHYRFPTIGEVVRELFNAAGILPQKKDETSVIGGEKHKKAIITPYHAAQKAITKDLPALGK
ncbi:TPA: hypothetical protein I7241_10650 [Vibrio vulnificus]|nr:hypothetical protein [Vibrio vulnificus]